MSSLPPLAFRLAVAPRFHLRAEWSQRLQANDGIEVDAAGTLWPRPRWRELSQAEEARWVGEGAAGDALLFNLPNHLRASWWSAVEGMEPGGADGGAYQTFVARTVEFLTFKQRPLPSQCAFDVRVGRPGLRSTRADAPGLGFDAPAAARRTLAWVNLGDEATHLVLVPVAGVHDMEALRRHAATSPDHPLLRLRLEPGEGLWFPAAPLARDGDTIDKLDLDAILVLSA